VAKTPLCQYCGNAGYLGVVHRVKGKVALKRRMCNSADCWKKYHKEIDELPKHPPKG
jgi:hypothetical protein